MKLQLVPAATGFLWVRQGIKTFLRQPLAMAGLFFLFMAAVSVLTVVPMVGAVLSLVLLPAATVGLMAASREAEAGRFPMPLLLLTAFRAGPARTRPMLILGALYAAGLLLVMGISTLFDGGEFARMYLGGGNPTPERVSSPGFQQAMWVAMLLYLPLAMSFWHAPALVHWHGVGPVKSLFFSAMACWRNKGAMLVYGLGWVGLFLVMGLALSLVGALLGSANLMRMAMFPVVLLMAAMFFTSIYFTFRDSFSHTPPGSGAQNGLAPTAHEATPPVDQDHPAP